MLNAASTKNAINTVSNLNIVRFCLELFNVKVLSGFQAICLIGVKFSNHSPIKLKPRNTLSNSLKGGFVYSRDVPLRLSLRRGCGLATYVLTPIGVSKHFSRTIQAVLLIRVG